MIRAIASDLDGTLLSGGHQLSARNERAVRAAMAEGILFLVATGRPTRWLWPLEAITALGCPIVTSNGALTLDTTGEVWHSDPIDEELVAEVISVVGDRLPHARFAVEGGDTWAREPDFGRELPDNLAFPVAPASQLPTDGVLKLLVWAEGVDSRTLHAQVTALVGDRLTCTYSYLSSDGLLELSAPGVTKAAAIARVLTDANIDAADLVAFGDMPNDLAMLRLAGHAMVPANAHQDLLAEGFTQVGHHASDGVGMAIEALLKTR